MAPSFTKAERKRAALKLAITGTSGSGKTYSALRLARGLVGENGRIAFIDTENNSATLYDNLTEFDHCEILPNNSGKFNFRDFIDKVEEAERLGYDCVIIDSATHLWQGILEDKTSLDLKGGNSYTNWAKPTKDFNTAIQKFLQSKMHVISCMRSKTEYVMETNERGKTAPRKVGLAPVMRDGIEYEFTVVFDVMINHDAAVSKDRTGLFAGEGSFLITENTGRKIAEWLSSGKEVPVQSVPPAPQPKPETVAPTAEPAAPSVPHREAEKAYLQQLAKEGIINTQEVGAIAKRYAVAKVTDLAQNIFEKFMESVRLHEAVVRLATKQGIRRSKLDEFAIGNGGNSLFDSSLETKQKIYTLITE